MFLLVGTFVGFLVVVVVVLITFCLTVDRNGPLVVLMCEMGLRVVVGGLLVVVGVVRDIFAIAAVLPPCLNKTSVRL